MELTAQLAHDVDPREAISLLLPGLAKIPNVDATPAPEVTVVSFNFTGPVLAVRPFCHNNNYWQVPFVEARYSTAEQPLTTRSAAVMAATN